MSQYVHRKSREKDRVNKQILSITNIIVKSKMWKIPQQNQINNCSNSGTQYSDSIEGKESVVKEN